MVVDFLVRFAGSKLTRSSDAHDSAVLQRQVNRSAETQGLGGRIVSRVEQCRDQEHECDWQYRAAEFGGNRVSPSGGRNHEYPVIESDPMLLRPGRNRRPIRAKPCIRPPRRICCQSFRKPARAGSGPGTTEHLRPYRRSQDTSSNTARPKASLFPIETPRWPHCSKPRRSCSVALLPVQLPSACHPGANDGGRTTPGSSNIDP